MKPARYIFINKGLGMSSGKIGAQAAHAETLAMNNFYERDWAGFQDDQEQLYDVWLGHGHYAKYVMELYSSTQMHTVQFYLAERGFKTFLVIDEGHTEDTYFEPTAMAVELVDKDNERTSSIFGEFKLYKDERSQKSKSFIKRMFSDL